MSDTRQVAALIEAAPHDVDFDGLTVENGTYGYVFETPEESHRGLSTDELGEVAAGDEYVANWYYWERDVEGHDTARRDFLRWVEHADRPLRERLDALRGDGLTREWGELLVTARLRDGEHVYEVRHVDDADRDDLDEHTDPLDARRIAKHDDDGDYRPLSTAPTLQHGWAFVDLDGDDLVRTVDFFYPATVANWHRERVADRGEATNERAANEETRERVADRGEATNERAANEETREGGLDVTHYREAAERQTGIYSIVDQLTPEELEWATEACCVDSQCLKRREWDYDEDTELDTPRGDGEFPCREPCSLFVSAARKFVTLEREDAEEYTFELTPTEKEQLEEILDAVAEGRAGEVREGDLNEAANRYRARYLRAKRMDDDGLSGTPTYE